MKTLRHYIETSLYTCPSLFSSRFEVLEHLFATLGNGVDLTEDGYIEHYSIHPSDLPDPYAHILTKEQELHTRYGSDLLEGFEGYDAEEAKKDAFAKAEKDAKKAVDWRNTYDAEPTCPLMYPWSTTEQFQPFRKYVGCKCPDFREHVEYFVKVIKEFNVEDLTLETMYPDMSEEDLEFWAGDDEVEERRQELQRWKDNIHLVEEALL